MHSTVAALEEKHSDMQSTIIPQESKGREMYSTVVPLEYHVIFSSGTEVEMEKQT